MEKNFSEFMELITCDINDMKCMFNEHVASRNVKIQILKGINPTKNVHHQYWKQQEIERVNS